MIGGFALTIVVKILRHRMETDVPTWAMDALPNLICGAVVPIAIFMGNRTIRALDFLGFCGLILVGLIVYETIQIWMPKRTFELTDIAASAVGALLAVSLGWIFFRRNMQAGEQSQ